MTAVKHVSLGDFTQEVLRSPVPVLIDFYAEWCGPCRVLGPILDRLAAEFAGQAKIVKINVDEEPELAGQFNVSSIPTLVYMVSGRPVARTMGLAPESQLRSNLMKLVGNVGSTRVG